MTTEQRPAGQRSQTRSFVYFAWPALAAWGLALVFVARPEGHSDVHVLVGLGVILAAGGFGVVTLVYTVVAAVANAPTKIRLLACAANLSVVVLLLWAPSFRSLITPPGPETIARVQCRTLHDKAMIWKMIHRKPPNSLDEMVAPLRPGDEEDFLEAVPNDPWDHPYVLEVNAKELRVRSFGPDGKKGTEDDVVYPVLKD